jgi:hypothetical protein
VVAVDRHCGQHRDGDRHANDDHRSLFHVRFFHEWFL